MRPSFLLVGIVIVAAVLGLWFFKSRPSKVETSAPAETHQTEAPTPVEPAPASAVVKEHIPAPAVPVPTAPRPEPSAHTRQLVSALTQLDFSKGPITPEQAALWKTNLSALVQQGAAAVPA